ncbi:hypothetical protein PPYR_04278 [Photinus pyralis]|uniref:Sm domain-containing protein n=3 Tax=Photinus pyralis TaxID=7054 RepID=A0A5N4AXJ7_PHOPY|nr:hypothetical protein PPYR_04278 [Photinus pyralis]
MAENEKAQQSRKDYDPSLDFFSEKFDPLKAILTPGVSPPIVDAKVYDNTSQFYQFYLNPNKQIVKAGSSKSQERHTEPERKWLPHQLPIPSKRKTRIEKNVLTNMETIKGPIKLLTKCKDERIQIKVWTRHSHGIRGYCIGYVTIFDKHWNLGLEEVTETWTRPKRRKIPAGMEMQECEISKGRLVPPPIKVIKSDEKFETCERHIDQLVIRGEQIVMIALLCTGAK